MFLLLEGWTMASIPICSRVFHTDSMKRRYEIASALNVRNDKVLPFQCIFDGPESDNKLFCMGTPLNSSSKVSQEIRGNLGQLKALDSYLEKVENKGTIKVDHGRDDAGRGWHVETALGSFKPGKNIVKKADDDNSEPLLKEKAGLGSLDRYFRRLNSGEELQYGLPIISEKGKQGGHKRSNDMDIYPDSDRRNNQRDQFLFGRENCHYVHSSEESSEPFTVSLLAAINIAVFFFDIASPVRNSSIDDNMSLPLMYGAKINELILDGEWWRLVTPMFLHSGFLHVALGCWALLNFGPHVWRGYGSFTFILIYFLGGIAGNLLSFMHTTDLTVGGTGPVFALVGAWLVYQSQNTEMIARQESNVMFQKAMATTLFIFILGKFEHVDDWTHLGAILAGVVFGYLTCPTMEIDNASSRNGQEEGITLLRRPVGPCVSLTIFTIILLVLSSVVFYLGPELSRCISEMDSLNYYSME